jgi:hypothetical protein
MPINFRKQIVNISLFLFILLQFAIIEVQAQIVWESPKHPVNAFLSRQAQKGNIEITDFILPLNRKDIAKNLSQLRDSVQKLSAIEVQELSFYEQEYSEFNKNLRDSTIFLKKDQNNRWGVFSAKNGDFILRADAVIGLETTQGLEKSILYQSNGMKFWGQKGKNISFQAFFTENTESGNGIDSIKQFNNQTGIVRTENLDKNAKMLNYTNFRGNITYSWENGSVSFGHDQLLWGYGENGRLVMSDKAPAYPFIRLDYQLLKWLKFNYAHTWLQSAILDSNRTYGKGNTIYGDERELFVQKFMATHSLNFFPTKGLSLSVGESIIYSDRIDAGYLIPIMVFKAYDQYSSRYKINSGSNSQFFFQAASRNHLKNTHLYATLFIDEIRLAESFNSQKSRNQLGFNVGGSITDVLIPYLTVGMEYTRINPFVYQNLVPAQNYTNQNYTLGDWIGQNADRVTAWVKYNPIARLSTRIQLDYIRKGEDGTLEDQYYAEPQPSFLNNKIDAQKQFLFEAKYQLLNELNIKASYYKQAGIIRPVLQAKAVPQEFRFGISYGF